MTDAVPTLEVVDLVKHFQAGRQLLGGGGVVHAIDGVSFSIAPGELLGLVGESGSGKSTVANCVIRLLEPTSGTIRLKGRDITHLSRREMRPLRSDVHMVFQDPYSSLNPRMTCGAIVGESSTTASPFSSSRWACGPSCDSGTRTSSPAASASGSASPARCRSRRPS